MFRQLSRAVPGVRASAAAVLAGALLVGAVPAQAAGPVLHPGTYYMSTIVQSATAGCPLAAGDAVYPGAIVYPGDGAGNKGANVTLQAVQAGATPPADHAIIIEMALGSVPAAGWSAVAATGPVKIGSVAKTKSYSGHFTVLSATSGDQYSVNGTFSLQLKLSATKTCTMTFSYGAIITNLV